MKIIESQNYPREFLIQLVHYADRKEDPELWEHLGRRYLVNVLGSAHSKFSTHRYTTAVYDRKEAEDIYRKVKWILDHHPQNILILCTNLIRLGFGTYDAVVLLDPNASNRVNHRRS